MQILARGRAHRALVLALLVTLAVPAGAADRTAVDTARVALAPEGVPVELGSFATEGSARRIFVRRHLAFVATDSYGLEILDVSDPRRPAPVATHLAGGYAYDVVATAEFAYLAANEGGLEIVDVREPSRPMLAASIPEHTFAGNVLGVTLSGGLLYVSSGFGGMTVLDVGADPVQPPTVGRFYTLGSQYHNDAIVADGLAYVADGPHGLTVIDVTDPRSPLEVAQSVPTSAQILDLALDGETVFGAAFSSGLAIYDVAGPLGTPLPELGTYPAPSPTFVEGLAVATGLDGSRQVYLAAGSSGMHVVDATDLSAPSPVAVIAVSSWVRGATVVGDRLYVAAGHDGVRIFSIDP